MQALSQLLFRIVSLGVSEDCDSDEATTRRVLMSAWIGVSLVTPLWGITYVAFGEIVAGLIPIVYACLTWLCILLVWRFGGWHWLRIAQLVQHLSPALCSHVDSLGGFELSSAVLIWSLLAPLSSLWGGRFREAQLVIIGFAVLTAMSGVIEPYLRQSNNLPEWLRLAFFVGNFTVMSGLIFLLVDYLVRRKNTTIEVMRRNRELELAYLQQEVSLRQSDKLATLGKLSAGLAHELNNPTAAAQQAARQLTTLLNSDSSLESETAGLALEG